MTVTGFFSFDGTQIISVKLENTARKIRIMEKGFIKLLNILLKRLSFLPQPTKFTEKSSHSRLIR